MPTLRHTYNFPTRIEYGPGAMKDLVVIIKREGFKKGLIVTDEGIVKAGIAEILQKEFNSAGIDVVIFSRVKSNPIDANAYDGAKVYKESKSEFVVGLGGGSPIDTAKVVKCLATHDGPLEKYDDAKGGDKYIQNNMPPFYAIPTTAGTGSEVGRSSVITIQSTNKKTIIFSPYLMPTIAVLDPEVTVSLPPGLTAATGVDAFVHNLEAYLMDVFHPFADGIAREGIYRSFKYLPHAVENGNDIAARGEMLMASAMGATAFQKGLGVNHSIAHALGVFYDTHHGLANAAVLVEVMKYNLKSLNVKQKLASLGPLLNTKSDAEAVINAIENWLISLNMPVNLKSFSIPAIDAQRIEDYALEDPCCPLNPRKVEKGDVLKIIQQLL
ncbi:iron-containing alcohol dehydrogenase [candidate division KSB1 bacterium]|nr:iron-containing alcohol dehydrogenase [candidate division KSB1 bacterium]